MGAILPLPVFGVREALGADGVRELPHPALTRRQLVLGVLRILHEPLGASGALLQRGGLERDGLELRELGPHGVVRSEEHTSELQSQSNLACRLLLEKK